MRSVTLEEAEALPDPAIETNARLEQLRLRYTTEPERTEPLIAGRVSQAIPILQRNEYNIRREHPFTPAPGPVMGKR
jgi:hypothetical protein